MRVGIAADHGGFALKETLLKTLQQPGLELVDFGAKSMVQDDDYPDLILPLAKALSAREIDRAIAICGSGVGACFVANRIPGVRAALIQDAFSAHQGVEDDDMNMICLGGRVTGAGLARDLIKVFLDARFIGAERHRRRLAKVTALERK